MSNDDRYVLYRGDDWSALYKNGKLIRDTVGDSYHADEKIREILGVVTIDNDDFFLGGNRREDVASSLDEIEEYNRKLYDDVDKNNRVHIVNRLTGEKWLLIGELDYNEAYTVIPSSKIMETDGSVRIINPAELRYIQYLQE